MKTTKQLMGLTQLETVKIGYARVSSTDNRQTLGLQVQTEALNGCDILFSEKGSGDNDARPELEKALTLAKQLTRQKKNVSFYIYKLDRLTRKMFTLATIIDELNNHHIQLVSLHEKLETSSLTGKLLCIVLGYVAEIELENIRLRTKDGLRKAKEQGKKLGNQGLSDKKELKICQLYQLNDLTIKDIAKRCDVCEATVYNVAKRNGLSRFRLNRSLN